MSSHSSRPLKVQADKLRFLKGAYQLRIGALLDSEKGVAARFVKRRGWCYRDAKQPWKWIEKREFIIDGEAEKDGRGGNRF